MIDFIIKIYLIILALIFFASGQSDDLVLLISYDAFRPEYLERNVTPFMNDLRKKGSYAEYMRNVFPTKTFTNHHTISTGLYPQVHGVLGNSVYDVKLKKELNYTYTLFHYNEDILPIWALNQKFGRNSGCMMWPGTDYPYNGRACEFTLKFNDSMPFNERVDKALSWFKDPIKLATFVMMYFEEPDFHGHAFSPESETITDMVRRMDNLTRYIEDKLKKENLFDRMNVIYVSDHGMDTVSSPNFINISSFLQNDTYKCYGSSPVIQIVPEEGKYNETLERLKTASGNNGHFKVYANDEVPERWHFTNPDRMGPITAVADSKYAFEDMYKSALWYEKRFHVKFTPSQKYGIHGYDNKEELMRAIFFAHGPKFQKEFLHPPFDNLDLFNLICLLLDIKPVPNNGTIENIRDLLVDVKLAKTNGNKIVLGISITVFTLLVIVGLSIGYRIYRKRHTNHHSLDHETLAEGISSNVAIKDNEVFNDADHAMLESHRT